MPLSSIILYALTRAYNFVTFDEPAFNVFFDEVNDWGMAALEKAIEGLAAYRGAQSGRNYAEAFANVSVTAGA